MKHCDEILMVEDNSADRMLLHRALKKNDLDHLVRFTSDGIEALEYLNCVVSGEYNIPKMIILDLKMPRMNGLELIAEIKTNEFLKHLPVIVLTSSAQDSDMKKAYELGANSYLVKPFEFEQLIQSIGDIAYYWLKLNRVSQA